MKNRKRAVAFLAAICMLFSAVQVSSPYNATSEGNVIVAENKEESENPVEESSSLEQNEKPIESGENLEPNAEESTQEVIESSDSISSDAPVDINGETEPEIIESSTIEAETNELPNVENAAENVEQLNNSIPEGYHEYNGRIYGNTYIFRYDPNNGEGEYEQENQSYGYPNKIYSQHYYDHVDTYNGLPVYNKNTPQDLIIGLRNVDYYIDDLTLARNVFDRDNYNFVNWNLERDGSGLSYEDMQEVNNEFSEDMYEGKLYAQWEIAKANITIMKTHGEFPMQKFMEENGVGSELRTEETPEGTMTYYAFGDSEIGIIDLEEKVYIEADCLTKIKIPNMLSTDPQNAFIGYDTSAKHWNAETKEFMFENKNAKPALKAIFLSKLQLEGEADAFSYHGEGGTKLMWGTIVEDDIEKVYKIAQSFDGENFEYIPDQNLTEYITGVEYNYTGDVQTFTAPISGKYYIEAWGANGGMGLANNDEGKRVGRGGKTSGYVNLKKGQTIYIYVGEAGKTYSDNGQQRPYGGGGAQVSPSLVWNNGQSPVNWREHVQGRGGGATYVSLTEKYLGDYIPENYTDISRTELRQKELEAVEAAKQHVLMLAAGGSGLGDGNSGADGGGLVGPSNIDTHYHYGTVNKWSASGGTQDKAGEGDYGTLNGMPDDYFYRTTTYGTFFYGANGMTCSGASGGGWFTGGMCYYIGGAGSSSYLGTSAGLYDADTVVGGNEENKGDAAQECYINGKVKIKVCEYWVTTNTSETVYTPDKAAPNTPEGLDVVLGEDKKGTISWNDAADNGSDYWFRVDAFDAEDYSTKISETDVKKFTITSETDGYYYIIDNNESTEVHEGNGTFTKDTSVSGVDILDVGKPLYLHVCTVDKAGNISGTATILLNKVTLIIDPNKDGTYNGSYDKQEFILNPEDVYTLSEITANEGQGFLRWERTTGDGIYDSTAGTVTMQYAKTTIVANYLAPLILEAKVNLTANDRKGALDLKWNEDDDVNKKYKVYISPDNNEWSEITVNSDSSDNKQTFAYAEDYQIYEVPYDGTYTLTAYGSKGGDYNTNTGGKGSSVSGQFRLNKGDKLYIYTGSVGTNGGGTGSIEGAAGGGATDIRLNGTDLSDRILVAAGGSGASLNGNGSSETSSVNNNGTFGNGTNSDEDTTFPALKQQYNKNYYTANEDVEPVTKAIAGGGGGYYGGKAYTKVGTVEAKAYEMEENERWIDVPVTPIEYMYCYAIENNADGDRRWHRINNFAWVVQYPMQYIIDGQLYYVFAHEGDTITEKPIKVESASNIYYDIFTGAISGGSESNPPTTAKLRLVQARAVDGGRGVGFYTIYFDGTNGQSLAYFKLRHDQWAVEYTEGTAGSSYIDLNRGTQNFVKYGQNNGDGFVEIVPNELQINTTEEVTQDGVIAFDKAAPNVPYAGRILSRTDSSITLTWAQPEDNGTPYYNRAESYRVSNNEKLKDSNVTLTDVVTGVKNYRWFADNNPDGIVTGANSVIADTNQITVDGTNLTQYYHVAAIDYAGNLGPTYTFQPLNETSVSVKVIWEDFENEFGTRPESGVKIVIYRADQPDVEVASKNLSSYEATEDVVFTGLTALDSANNPYVYKAKIVGVTSKNGDYSYDTAYSDDTLTITNSIRELTKKVKINISWDDADNNLDTRPDKVTIEVLDVDGNVITTVEADNNQPTLDVKVPIDKEYTIRVEQINSKHPENPYTTEIDGDGSVFNVDSKLKYLIEVDPNGGTWNGSTEVSSFTEYPDASINLPKPERTGYKFLGWEIVEGDITVGDESLTVKYSNAKITAKWEKLTLGLSVNPNGGLYEGSPLVTEYEMEYGEMRSISVPTRKGYIFNGWTLEGTGATMTSLIAKSVFKMGIENASLTAAWQPKNIVVTFDPEGGTVDVDNKTVVYDSPYGELPVPTKPGCSFIRWEDENGNEINKDTIVSIPDDHTLHAVWQTNETSITGKVVWIDENNKHDSRPENILINILADGKFVTWAGEKTFKGTQLTSTNADWLFSKTNLQEYDFVDNKTIEYSIEIGNEDKKVPSMNIMYAYQTEIKKEADGSFTITNTLIDALKDITGTVTWIDDNDKSGARPEEITIVLFRDGEAVGETTLTYQKDNTWSYSFKDMQIYRDDFTEYEYTVGLKSPVISDKEYESWYKTEIDGFNITNTLLTSKLNIKINWVNEDNLNKVGVDKKYLQTAAIITKVDEDGNPTSDVVKVNLKEDYIEITGLRPGKYEISPVLDPRIIISGIEMSDSKNISFIEENGKYFIIFDEDALNFNAHIEMNLDIEWSGYQSGYPKNNYFKK